MANTKMIGEISEAIVIAEFLKSGIPVLLPFGDNQRYDMVVEVDGSFLRVQCKTARALRGGAVLCFKTKSTNRTRPITSRSYRNQADLFAAYSPYTKQVYVLPVEEAGEAEVWLRLTPAKNGQVSRVRHAEEHTLAAWAGAAVNVPTSTDPRAV